MNTQKKAFTLVELIVVIVILAILGTIAFISLEGYSSQARDSTRVTDLSSMKLSLELFYIDAGKYPETTNGFVVTYSGSNVWTQGTFGEVTKTNVVKLDKIPTDPLISKEYTYSLTQTKQEYQLSGIMEGESIVLNKAVLKEANAGTNEAIALVTGNYNGKVLKTNSGVICEVLSLPSIISSLPETTTNLTDILTAEGLVYNGYKNLASNYISSKYNANGGFAFNPHKLVSYSDTGSCAALYNSEDNTARITLITNLQTSYSGTILANVDGIRDIVNLDINNIGLVSSFASTFINNSLGGKILVSGGGGSSSGGGGLGYFNIGGGNSHTCALISGVAQCWGLNTNGQLGDGTTTQSTRPVQVSGLTSGVSSIMGGSSHSCAILSSGGVKCWGLNTNGQLGNGTTTQSTIPVQVSGLTSGVLSISGGTSHTCALLSNGGVQCWGLNSSGQLGNGTTTQSTTPVQVSGLGSGVSSISVGATHSCAILTSGGVQCWGLNTNGQLGDGTTTQSNIPVQVSGLTSGVSSISLGKSHTCAVLTTGAVQCWGLNTNGQLGNGTTTQSTIPVQVTLLTSGVSKVSLGLSHTCVLLTTGGVKCFGLNTNGQLGDGSTTQRTTSVQVSGLTSGVSGLYLGSNYSCAILTAGGIKCWGLNTNGQLGNGTIVQNIKPMYIACIDGYSTPYLCPQANGNNRFEFTTGTTAGGTSVVYDKITGLSWQSEGNTQGPMNFINAKSYCANLDLGGQTDWRLPDYTELLSIVDFEDYSYAIDNNYFTINQYASSRFWTSTVDSNDTTLELIIEFQYGDSNVYAKTSGAYFRCIR